MVLQYLNYNGHAPQDVLNTRSTFNITVTAPQDFWRQPPDVDIFTAPALYEPMPLLSFMSARITVTGNWKTLFDQGGLFIVLPPRSDNSPRRWIKAGIEFYYGAPQFSVVVASSSADWSMMPIPADSPIVTVEIERGNRGVEAWDGKESLWVYLVDNKGQRRAVRQVTDAFLEGDEGEIWVGAYAGKPEDTEEGETGSSLTVSFSDFIIKQHPSAVSNISTTA